MEGVRPEIPSNAYGDDDIWNNSVNPLLVDLVLQKVFSFSALKDLLASRRVCKIWGPLATQELRSREEVVARIGGSEDGRKDEAASMTDFIKVMTPALESEAGMPVIRIHLSLRIIRVGLSTIDLLRFIAPWVHVIRLNLLISKSGSSSNQVSQVIRVLEGGLDGLPLPALRELEVGNDFVFLTREQPQRLDIATMSLVKGLLRKAKELTRYDHMIRFAVDDSRQELLMDEVIRALPISLKRLAFWQNSSGTFLSSIAVQQSSLLLTSLDFAVLSNCLFQLEEYRDSTYRATSSSSAEDVLAFLLRQAGTLRKLRMSFLDHLYHNVYPTFPHFPLLTELETYVSQRSRFDWIARFPGLRHLILQYREIDESSDPPAMTNPGDISRLPRHQGVRSLGIRRIGRGESTVRFDILRHIFPNLTRIDLTVSGGFEKEEARLCTHMMELEELKLTGEVYRRWGHPFVHPDLEAILCGLPLRVAVGDPSIHLPAFGLANLKKLKRLEVTGKSRHFQLILTPLTVFHTFRRMPELKDIRLNDLHPQALDVAADIIQELRAGGIEVNERKCDDLTEVWDGEDA